MTSELNLEQLNLLLGKMLENDEQESSPEGSQLTSPFARYSEVLLKGCYGVAEALQRLTLSLYCGAPVFKASKLRNFDEDHFHIFEEMTRWYRKHGESDQEFMVVGRELQRRWRDEGFYAD